MLTSLSNYLKSRGHEGDCLSYVLPKMIRRFGTDFRRFADCGGGVGHTSIAYRNYLSANLSVEDLTGASIFTYEPLNENLTEMSNNFSGDSIFTIRPVAVSDVAGKARFTVPRRMTGQSLHWGEGTSAVGFLGTYAASPETIEVDTVRLEDEAVEHFDFVKLDLQGGERNALIGLGSKLSSTKVIYAEHQLLGTPSSQPLDFLLRSGFVCFIDKLQFSAVVSRNEIPMSLLRECGIRVERIILPDQRGMAPNLTLFGVLDMEQTKKIACSGSLPQETIDSLRSAGVDYMQTDILAINNNVYRDVLDII